MHSSGQRLPRFRQWSASLRERQKLVTDEARTDMGWRRAAVIAGCATIVMTILAPLDSVALSFWPRLVYWASMMLIGTIMGVCATNLMLRHGWKDRPFRTGLVGAALLTLPLSLLASIVPMLAFGQDHFPLAQFGNTLIPCFTLSCCMFAINLLANRQPRETREAIGGAQAPRFLDRLPAKLHGAELWAVEAEDHYLRLHTSLGEDLLLLRLSDAIAELEGIAGAQTHRSWWIARHAVIASETSNGRAMLCLKNGTKVPVSRSYMRALRADGWFASPH